MSEISHNNPNGEYENESNEFKRGAKWYTNKKGNLAVNFNINVKDK